MKYAVQLLYLVDLVVLRHEYHDAWRQEEMRFWFDTEFIEDGRTIDLISIGTANWGLKEA